MASTILTYPKGNTKARTSPQMNKVAQKTNRTPWQDVMSNCTKKTNIGVIYHLNKYIHIKNCRNDGKCVY